MHDFWMRLPLAGEDAAPAIEALLNRMEPGDRLSFEPGRYPLASAIRLCSKQDVILDGNGCTFVPHYDREAEFEADSGVFDIRDCQNIVLKCFSIDASMPANSAGTILAVGTNFVDVHIDSSVPFTGREQYISGMTYGEDGIATCHYWLKTDSDPTRFTLIGGEIPTSNPRVKSVPYETIGDQTYRVYTQSLGGLAPGMRCSVSHSYYGPVACIFKNCDTVLLEDVRFSNFGGFGITIFPRCRDFTFRRVVMKSEDPHHQPFALTSDGIHITGLMGKALFEDCEFVSCGDDFLNMHTYVMKVLEKRTRSLCIDYGKVGKMPVPPTWALPGDSIRVYDPDSLQLKGILQVESFVNAIVTYQGDVDVQPGDLLTNAVYFPEVTVRRCTFDRPRTRSLVFQSVDRLLVEDCTFLGVHGASVYCSAAFDFWYEAGPVKHVTIRHNRFIGNGDWERGVVEEWGAVFFRVWGEKHKEVAPIHQDICVENNYFAHLGARPIVVTVCDGVRVTNNTIVDCDRYDDPIRIAQCQNVVCEKNSIQPTRG